MRAKRSIKGMEKPFWFAFCVLILHAARIAGISHFKEEPPTLVILKHFHPPDDEPYSTWKKEDCNDPCVLNATLRSKHRETVERSFCKRLEMDCTDSKNSPYRRLDGSCNNLLNPDWGMAQTCHKRFLPHDYADGVSYPRMSCLHEELPSARVVSNYLHKAQNPKHQVGFTLHFMELGQVFSHDVSFAEIEQIPDLGPGSCCDPYPRVDENCIAVKIPHDDEFYRGKRSCLGFQRTFKCPLCKGGVRESLNNVTSYFDLSIVYGTSEAQMRNLRSYKNGMLRVQKIPDVGDLLPPVKKMIRCNAYNSTRQCFLGGDARINQNVLLSSFQTVLLRHHNNICIKLKTTNSHWNDELLFQEAKKINIAVAQKLVFGEFVQHVLGTGITGEKEFQLDVLPGKRFTEYDPSLDASTIDEFASAAHRFGHTLIPDIIFEKDPVSGRNRTISMQDSFSWPFDFYTGQFDRLALGMSIEHPKHRSVTLNSGVRNWLYQLRYENEPRSGDLAATSIARGREHGIPGYTNYRKHFFNHDVRSFCDLRGWIPGKLIEKMMTVYRSVHDIDLYTAVLAENKVDGGLIGPTGAAILATQYRHLKFGDRYYFEHRREAGSFTPDQLMEIKKTTFARILCETTKISHIQPDVFLPASKRNEPVPCDELHKMNFKYWKED